MYDLVAYLPFMCETWQVELGKHPPSPKRSRFSSLNLGSWKTGSFRSKSTEHSSIGSGSLTINSYKRQSHNISRTITTVSTISESSTNVTSSSSISKNSTNVVTRSNNSKNSNNITTNNSKNSNSTSSTSNMKNKNSNNKTTASSGLQIKHSTAHREASHESPADSSGSSVDEDEDLYEFDIYEDERRYRPILKHTSKYAPVPVPATQKSRGLWRIFGSHRKPETTGNLQSGTTGIPPLIPPPAEYPGSHRSRTGVSVVSYSGKGCDSPLPGSDSDLREYSSSDGGYSSDGSVTGEMDLENFLLTQAVEKKKRNVHFSDPLVTHIYRHSYKSYIPRDAALVTLKI